MQKPACRVITEVGTMIGMGIENTVIQILTADTSTILDRERVIVGLAGTVGWKKQAISRMENEMENLNVGPTS